ncbi:MAG: hypothetical protein PUA56_06200 [Bacillales bacterium]|nr:hypothetical protein [Bacillales bacterium]
MKDFFKFIFKGSINNQELIDNSKVHSFLSSLLILIISLVIAIVPSFVTAAKQKGSQVLTVANNQSLNTSLSIFTDYLDKENLDIVIKDGKIDIENTSFKDGKKEYLVTVPNREDSSKQDELLAIRLCTNDQLEETINRYKSGMLEGSNTPTENPRSYLIFTETNIYISLYSPSSTNTFDKDKDGFLILDDDGLPVIKTYASAAISYKGTTEKIKNEISIKTFNDSTLEESKYDETTKNWANLLDVAFKPYRTQNMWVTAGIYSAINFGTVLLVSLLLVIMTHLKHSVGNKINYLEALKIASYSALAPAIVSIILGFIISSFATIGFVMCLSLRSTFIAMKLTNPNPLQ